MEKVKANRVYLALLILLLTAACAGSVTGAFIYPVYPALKIPLIMCAVVTLAADIAAFILIASRVETGESEITVKVLKRQTFRAEDISSIEWRFFEGKNGMCYINMKDGRSAALPRGLFGKELRGALSAFAEKNGVEQHLPEQ